MRGRIKHDLRNLAEKFDGLFGMEVERILDRMRYLKGSDGTREAVAEFVRRVAREIRADNETSAASATAPG